MIVDGWNGHWYERVEVASLSSNRNIWLGDKQKLGLGFYIIWLINKISKALNIIQADKNSGVILLIQFALHYLRRGQRCERPKKRQK